MTVRWSKKWTRKNCLKRKNKGIVFSGQSQYSVKKSDSQLVVEPYKSQKITGTIDVPVIFCDNTESVNDQLPQSTVFSATEEACML